MYDIINEIKKTGYLENQKIGSYFHLKYPTLYRKIIDITSEIENTYVINTNLRARVIFLVKYFCDLNKLKNEDKWLSFNRSKDDFIRKSINSAKKGWDNKLLSLNGISVLSKEKTINELKNLSIDEIFGKSKNRVLMSKNPSLYKSIEFHSTILNNLNKITKKFPARVLFLRDLNGDEDKIKCPICKIHYRLFSEEKKYFNDSCKKCYLLVEPKYPQKEWFINKYGSEWEKQYIGDREKIKSIKVNSTKWFVTKYGQELGLVKHSEYINRKINNIINLKNKGVSKISQYLFWEIFKKLEDTSECYFHELNKEILLRDGNEIYFPDFVCGNKIIEYYGVFWHENNKDKKRNEFYNKLGYELLVITSDDFNRNKKDIKIIKKCLNFLKNEI